MCASLAHIAKPAGWQSPDRHSRRRRCDGRPSRSDRARLPTTHRIASSTSSFTDVERHLLPLRPPRWARPFACRSECVRMYLEPPDLDGLLSDARQRATFTRWCAPRRPLFDPGACRLGRLDLESGSPPGLRGEGRGEAQAGARLRRGHDRRGGVWPHPALPLRARGSYSALFAEADGNRTRRVREGETMRSIPDASW